VRTALGLETRTLNPLASPVLDFLYCSKKFMNMAKIWQEIIEFFISTISYRSFPDCEYKPLGKAY
jgi:hypothetical protein